MFNLTVRAGAFLSKHMWLWWVLNFTWGIVWTVIGAFVAAIALMCGGKPSEHHTCIAINIGDNWGGLELGIFFLVANNMGDDWEKHTRQHEFGHSFQNAIFGPFAIIFCVIPSAVRYWWREIKMANGLTNGPYDRAWFEGSATTIGENYDKQKEAKEI